jgi:micrococcal nuclease
MSRKYSRRRIRELLVLLVVAILAGLRITGESGSVGPPVDLPWGPVAVKRVIDGDTLLLSSGARLRLQGIDAPETKKEDHPVEAWGKEAADYAEHFMEEADWRVRVELGPERKDHYDRFLGFVWHADRLLNEELVREGLARATTHYDFSGAMKRRLIEAQAAARSAGRGLWADRTAGQ